MEVVPYPTVTHLRLACWGVPSALLWTTLYLIGDRLILRLLPKDVPSRLSHKKKTDPAFQTMCNMSSVAFIHSVIVTPLALFCVFDPDLRQDPIHAKSYVLLLMSVLLLGYFTWDVVICVLHYRSCGAPFLVHAVLSFLIVFMQVGCQRFGCGWHMAVATAAELSTPFLHLRWFMKEANMFDRKEFAIVNGVFLVSFAILRLVMVEVLTLSFFVKESISPNATAGMNDLRRWIVVLSGVMWGLLQYFWGLPIIVRQLKRMVLSKGSKTTSSDKKTT